MSTRYAATTPCPACGHAQDYTCVESANVDRHPEFIDEVCEGRFMATRCDACGARFVVERELLFTWLSRGWFIGHFPRVRQAELPSLHAIVEASFRAGASAPGAALAVGDVHRRVVFGYDALREKVLCARHGLDDRALDALKLGLLTLRPDLCEPDASPLALVQVDGARGLLMLATWRPSGASETVEVPVELLASFGAVAL